MSLFSLFKKQNPAHAKTHLKLATRRYDGNQCLAQYVPWDTPILKTFKLDGDERKNIYVYAPNLLPKLRKGQELELSTVPADGAIVSTLSGEVWDTSTSYGTLIAYHGNVIGTLSYDTKALAHYGWIFTFKAICTGHGRGFPYLEAEGDFQQIKNWIKFKEHFGGYLQSSPNEEIDGVTRIFDMKRIINLPPLNCVSIINSKMLPVRKGSTAKPHIMMSINNNDLLEISAQNGLYNPILNHGDKNIYVYAYQTEIDTQEKQVHLQFLFSDD